jgi:hypothetical protein
LKNLENEAMTETPTPPQKLAPQRQRFDGRAKITRRINQMKRPLLSWLRPASIKDVEELSLPLIQESEAVLKAFLSLKQSQQISQEIERKLVVAHATLSAFEQYWPSHAEPERTRLLELTSEIREQDPDHWTSQRRLAVTRLIRAGLPTA